MTDRRSLDRALVATGFSYEAERRAEQAELMCELLPRVRDLRRAGAAALDLAWLAAGRVDAYFERGLKPGTGRPAGCWCARPAARPRSCTASRTAWWPRRRRAVGGAAAVRRPAPAAQLC